MTNKTILATALLSCAAFPAMSAENFLVAGLNAGKEVFTGWAGNVEAGATLSNGNKEEKEFNLDLKAQKEGDAKKWGYKVEAYAESEEEENKTIDEEYRASFQARYNISDVRYAFGEFSYLNDRFEGYKQRLTETFGYGYKFSNTEQFKLSGEVSVGARQTKFTNDKNENSFVAKLSVDAMYKFNDNVAFVEDFELALANGTNMLSESAIKVNFTESFYGKTFYKVEYNSDVPANTKETDTTLGFKLGYSF